MIQKTILDLCGGTGSWSAPYKQAGYTVILVTLPYKDVSVYQPPDNVYGILAAPPCTDFSVARTTAKTPRDLKRGFIPVLACLNIIWKCQTEQNTRLKFWCMENPRGLLRRFLGRPLHTFNPCDYGDGYTKATDLWGYFNMPEKHPVSLTPQQSRDCSINNRILPEVPDDYICIPDIRKQAVRRAITPGGFAKAFCKSNL